MQVSIDNDELEKKVAIALKGINGRSLAQAILKCIIIKAKEDEILLEATNLEIGLRVKVDGTVEEEGCCAIDGKSLADISRKMPDGYVVIQSDEKTAVISGKKVKIKLPVSDVESFPGLSRALLLLADKVQKPLVVQVAENKVTLEAATTAGEMSESINAVTEGESEPLRIGYNPRYLMEILQAIEDETIDLSLGGAKDPCLIKGMDYLYVLLPVSLGKTEAAL